MKIVPYENMKNYIDFCFKQHSCTKYIAFKMQHFNDSIVIVETTIFDKTNSFNEVKLTKAQIDNFTEHVYYKKLNQLLLQIKKEQINTKLKRIEQDF